MLSASNPFTFLLFGASGNLAQLKIYPALYVLALKKRLPKDYAIVGYARTAMDDAAFRKLVEESVRKDMGTVTEEALREFLTHVHYAQGQYDDANDLRALAATLKTVEKGWRKSVRLAYLSVPPQVMAPLLETLCAAGIHTGNHTFRCIVEKPVGHDLASFEVIYEKLTKCLPSEEIYPLDHYLGKEAVRNVYYLRYANPLLERLFKNTLIHHVEITAAETLGIEGRAGYFEHTGAFRDMFQSHLLLIASLLTMQVKDGDSFLPESRRAALEQFYLPPAGSLDDVVMQGQYAPGTVDGKTAKGYREEEGVDPESRTNTYAALKLGCREAHWQGVPFYLRSGKRMGRKETRISLVFLEPRAVGKGGTPNRLDMILQGEAGMRIFLQTKLGGSEPAFRPLILTDPLVCVGDCLPEHGLLILEAIAGHKTWFLAPDEIRSAWRLTDPIQSHFDRADTPLHFYPAGTDGPVEATKWMEREGLSWL
ncbi:MAG: glucose-6-phosphate dehydrogenase [Candidatus Peribacteraceae bacterium]|nr:glucose-6-phosphate dehydrogenase [Candidatus Peribacteraceae bacterium]